MFTIANEIIRSVRARLANRSTGNAELDAAVDTFIATGEKVIRLKRRQIQEEEARQLRLFEFRDPENQGGDLEVVLVGMETAGGRRA